MSWYYVDSKNERVGPVSKEELLSLITNKDVGSESYVWTSTFDDWTKVSEVDELRIDVPLPVPEFKIEEKKESSSEDFDWDSIGDNDQVISIKIGTDRNASESEYGPYTIENLKLAYNQNRINGKTYIFIVGMSGWKFLAETPLFKKITEDKPPEINEDQRRQNIRKPFIARLLFVGSNSSEPYEGICRDISIGGLQILVANYPGEVNDILEFNVHPDNSEHGFTAKGKIVRLLDGGQGFSLIFTDLSEESEKAIKSYLLS